MQQLARFCGVRTLLIQDISDPKQFGTMRLVTKCLTFLHSPVLKCLRQFGTEVHKH